MSAEYCRCRKCAAERVAEAALAAILDCGLCPLCTARRNAKGQFAQHELHCPVAAYERAVGWRHPEDM